MFGRTNVGSNEDTLAYTTSLYTLHFFSLPHHRLIWSLFTLLVSYPVEQARRQNIHVVGRAFGLTINVITSPQRFFHEHGDACLVFKASTLTDGVHISITSEMMTS